MNGYAQPLNGYDRPAEIASFEKILDQWNFRGRVYAHRVHYKNNEPIGLRAVFKVKPYDDDVYEEYVAVEVRQTDAQDFAIIITGREHDPIKLLNVVMQQWVRF